MKVLTPSRVIAAASLALAALSFGVAYASTGSGNGPPQGAGPACVHGTALLERNKANVVAYYTLAFNEKKPEEAVALYGGDMYIQHNPLAANGFQAFIDFVNFFTAGPNALYPNLHIDIKRVVAECDLVVTHGIIGGLGTEDAFGDRGSKVVDIFRIDKNGKIVEHWDVLAQISATSANGNPEV